MKFYFSSDRLRRGLEGMFFLPEGERCEDIERCARLGHRSDSHFAMFLLSSFGALTSISFRLPASAKFMYPEFLVVFGLVLSLVIGLACARTLRRATPLMLLLSGALVATVITNVDVILVNLTGGE